MTYVITAPATRETFGCATGATPREALDERAREAGYPSYARMCELLEQPPSTLLAVAIDASMVGGE